MRFGQISFYHDETPKPAIRTECEAYNAGHTFNMVNEYDRRREGASRASAPPVIATEGSIVQAVYLFMSCRKFKYFFFLRFGKDAKNEFVMKVRQERRGIFLSRKRWFVPWVTTLVATRKA